MTGTETTSSYAGENSEAVEHRPNHPEVYERLRGWLKPPGGRSEASSARDFALT